jgi:hypothetical protein
MKKSDVSLGPCEFCGANMDIVGKAHVCRPRPASTIALAAKVDKVIDAGEQIYMSQPAPKRRRAEARTIDVPAGPDATRQVVVQTLRRKAKNMTLPDPHPECKRCEEQARRARDRMRVRRGGS